MTPRIKITLFLSITILFSAANLGITKPAQAVQSTIIASVARKAPPLTGIKKLKNDNIRAVILGDSIAVSQGSSNPLTAGWNSDLDKYLAKKYSNTILWDNKASSGTLVDYCLQRAQEIDINTDVVFICVGRNDRNFYTPKQFSGKYTELIQVIKSKAPNADIFCIVEPPMVSSDESLFKGIRSAIIKVSSKTGVNLLDVWSAFPINQTALESMLSDGLHPQDIGYKRMSWYIFNRLVSMINT